MWLQSGSLTDPTIIRLKDREHEHNEINISRNRSLKGSFTQSWSFTPSSNLCDFISPVNHRRCFVSVMFTFFRTSLVFLRRKVNDVWTIISVWTDWGNVSCVYGLLWCQLRSLNPLESGSGFTLCGVSVSVYSTSNDRLDYIMLPSARPLTPADSLRWRSGGECFRDNGEDWVTGEGW